MEHRDQAVRQLYRRAVALIDGFSADLPPYRSLPPSLVEADFVHGVRLNVHLFFRLLIQGTEPTETDTAELVELAASRVRDGVPLDEVLGNYRTATTIMWSQLAADASEGERAVLLAAALPLAQYLSLTTARIAMNCLDRTHDPRWEQLERRRGIADALLAGADPGEWAHDPANPVADRFLVLVARLDRAGRTAVSDLRNRIDAMPGTFLRLDGAGATALVPLAPGDDGAVGGAKLESELAVPKGVWVAMAPASTRAAVPAAFQEAKVLAELGRCLNHPEAVCRLRRLMFEYTVAVSGEARHRLAAILRPLDEQPILSETLAVFLDHDCNQLATARLLTVHRNTVTYRLSRIAELTGFDPVRPSDAMTLCAARIARKLAAAGFAA